MKLIQVNWSPSDRQLRQFGFAAALALPGLAWMWSLPQSGFITMAIVGAVCAALALIRPRLLKPVFLGLSVVTVPIGLVVSQIALLAMFLFVFLPIGLAFRLLRRDALQLHPASVATYWKPKPQPQSAASYYRQW